MSATEIGGRYRLEGRLGHGGMSTVHRAFDERLATTEWLGIASIGAGLAIVSVRAWLASRRGERDVVEAPAIEGG